MPRKSRIDTPGALHHIIARGIERRRIFEDDEDRFDFVANLGHIQKKFIRYMQSVLTDDPDIDDLLQWENEGDLMAWLDSL